MLMVVVQKGNNSALLKLFITGIAKLRSAESPLASFQYAYIYPSRGPHVSLWVLSRASATRVLQDKRLFRTSFPNVKLCLGYAIHDFDGSIIGALWLKL